MARTQGRGSNVYNAGTNMSGTIYGNWPFYCSESYLPDKYAVPYWYSDVGRWIGYFTLRIIACSISYTGVYRINDDGTYSEYVYDTV